MKSKIAETELQTRRVGRVGILMLALVAGFLPASAQVVNVGQTVPNLELTRRGTGEKVFLHDLKDKVILIEWFAWWCPFCQAAAPAIRRDIVDYYAGRGGNANGVEVLHIGANLQAGQDTQTNNFITANKLDFVIEDPSRNLAGRFLPGGGQPLFVIINGAGKSEKHEAWELLFKHDGYGNLSQPTQTFRGVIDTVLAPLVAMPTLEELFPQRRELGEGWLYPAGLPGFGLVQVESFPWIYHPDLGYWYWSRAGESRVAYDPQMGWLYLDLFPYLYRFQDGVWLYYATMTRNPRYFFNFSTTMWEGR